MKTRIGAAIIPLVLLTVFGQCSIAFADVLVGNTSALMTALSLGQPGDRILVLAGTYELNSGIHVPDGVTVAGEGTMLFDEVGRPLGMALEGRTVLKSVASLSGDVVTLGNGAGLQDLVIEDFEGRAGNAVAVPSRGPRDTVSVWISRCEIINRTPAAASPVGPIGRGVLLITRNPNFNSDPPPHEDSAITLNMTQTLVRSPAGGSGVMALNFASRSRITAILNRNVLGGGLDSAGGVSRPDSVSDSIVTFESSNNLYRSDSLLPSAYGWNLVAGTDAPVPGLASRATRRNSVFIGSTNDSIEGFAVGIYGHGGRRFSSLAADISDNVLKINASRLKLTTITSDLSLYGDFSHVAGSSAGDRNVARLALQNVTGSGLRNNVYYDSSNQLGAGNALELAGSSTAFGVTNQHILPAPSSEFFTAGR